MYVRVMNFEARPHLEVEEISAVYHAVIDAVGECEGFLGSTLLLSEDTHRGMAMTFWQDSACAATAAPKYLEVITGRVYDLVQQPPVIAGYHVLDEEVFGGTLLTAGYGG